MGVLNAKPEIVKLESYCHGDDAIKYHAIDFSANINPLGPPKEILEFIREVNAKNLAMYPDTNCTKLKKELSLSLSVPTKQIVVGNGSIDILRLFCQVFLKKGDEAIIPVPTFSEYERITKLHGGRCKFVLMDNLKIDASKVINSIGKKSKIIFLCNPNNPTSFYSEEISEILEEAEKKKVLVFLDEAFIDFTNKKSFVKEISPNLFVLKSATKIFSIPALRCGYGFSDKKTIEYMEKAATPWNVNYIAQEAVRRGLKNSKFIKKTRKFIEREKKYIFSELKKISPFKIHPSDTNFFLVKTRNLTSHTLKKKLLEKGFLIRDCSNFRGLDESYFRICVRKHEDNKKLIEELRKIGEEIEG